MFTEPPAELIDQFEIVHVRLIGLVIKDNDVLSVIRNLRKLLRMNITYQSFFSHKPFLRPSNFRRSLGPNGYLQWDEVDTVGGYIDTIDSSLPTPALHSLFKSPTIPKPARDPNEYAFSLFPPSKLPSTSLPLPIADTSLFSRFVFSYRWKSSLSATLDQNGFQDSKLYTYKCDMSMARYWHDM